MSFRLASAKILSPGIIAERLTLLRRQQRRSVLAGGSFDLLHAGHVRFLQAARALGDCLVVALNSDEQVRRLKGAGRPVLNQDERGRILAALNCVDFVCVRPESAPEELLRLLRPDVLAVGGAADEAGVPGREALLDDGGAVRMLGVFPGPSTTEILRKIQRDSRPPATSANTAQSK